MARGSRSGATGGKGTGGGVTRRTGSPLGGGGTGGRGSGRGFIPAGNKGAAGGPAVRRTGGDLKPAGRTASNKVTGKG